MAGGLWPGGRLTVPAIGLLQLIRQHEHLVEVDLQQTYRVDFRDWYRPRGGESRLTTRRLLLLVDRLPREESHFWPTVTDQDPVTNEEFLLMDLFNAFTGELHPRVKSMQLKEKRRRLRDKAAEVKAAEAERTRRLERRRE